MLYQFSDFRLGDAIHFYHTFSDADFELFYQLSGDDSLSHDPKKASLVPATVPLHMVLAPFSRIAGKNFPGFPSLCLGSKISAVAPVYYNQSLCFSARIIEINQSQRVLTLQVIVSANDIVVVEAEMKVQATSDVWDEPPELPVFRLNEQKKILIWGGEHDVAYALICQCLGAGFHVTTFSYDPIKLQSKFSKLNGQVDCLNYAEFAAYELSASVVVFLPVALTSMDSAQLLEVIYSPWLALRSKMLSAFLKNQTGLCLTTTPQHGDCDFVYADMMGMIAHHLSSLTSKYQHLGIHTDVIQVERLYSTTNHRYADLNATRLPHEIAEQLFQRISHFYDQSKNDVTTSTMIEPASSTLLQQTNQLNRDLICNAIGRMLKLSDRQTILDAKMNITPRWDSLRQIEIILEIERISGKKFQTHELLSLTSTQSLLHALAL